MTTETQRKAIDGIIQGLDADVLHSADHSNPAVKDVFDKVAAHQITPEDGIARLKSLASMNAPPIRPTTRIEYGRNRHHSAYVDGCVNMLLARSGLVEPGPDYDAFQELTSMRMAGDIVRMHGGSLGANPQETLTRALGTDDFPNILSNTASKAANTGYDLAPEVWPILVRQTETRDFRLFDRVTASELPSPKLTQEGGEIQHAALGSDSKETGQVASYLLNIGISREALISDDLDRLVTTAESAGRAASRVTGDLVFSLLTTNAALSQDGIALFHASHGNLGTAGTPSVTTLDELRGLMSDQSGPAGENLNISPAILVGPRNMESTLAVLRGSMVDPLNPDPLEGTGYQSGTLAFATDGRLGPATTAWFAIANPKFFSGIDVVSLAGRNKRPLFERIKTPLNRDGVTYRLMHDVAAVVVDYRTLAKNAGA